MSFRKIVKKITHTRAVSPEEGEPCRRLKDFFWRPWFFSNILQNKYLDRYSFKIIDIYTLLLQVALQFSFFLQQIHLNCLPLFLSETHKFEMIMEILRDGDQQLSDVCVSILTLLHFSSYICVYFKNFLLFKFIPAILSSIFCFSLMTVILRFIYIKKISFGIFGSTIWFLNKKGVPRMNAYMRGMM